MTQEQKKTEFVYATTLAYTDDHGDLKYADYDNSGVVTGDFTEMDLVRSTLEHAAPQLGVEPANISVLRFDWTTY